MAIESASYISDLNAANPAAADGIADGDNHLRLLKQVLKTTFPNISGSVTPTHIELKGFVPIGGIILWSGTVATIPAGWMLCNGGTTARSDGAGNITAPDLREKFVIGAKSDVGADLNPGETGGSLTPAVAVTVPSHTHGFTSDWGGNHNHGGVTGSTVLTIDQIPAHTHTGGQQGTTGGGNNVFTGGGATTLQTGSTGGGLGHNHTLADSGTHQHTGTTDPATPAITAAISDGRPPFYALAFIIKV